MNMTLIKVISKHIPLKGYIALTFYPWVFIRKDRKKQYTPTVNRHEITHGLQQIETLWLFFLLLYILEYLLKSLVTLSWARGYRSVSFEQEAYLNQGKKNYNAQRKHYAWVKHIFSLYNK